MKHLWGLLIFAVLVQVQVGRAWMIHGPLHRSSFRSIGSNRFMNHEVKLCSSEADVYFEEHLNSMSDTSLKQLSLIFDCDLIDPDEISELLLELGVLSVSVEVQDEKPGALNSEENWMDLVKTRSWSTALLTANVPISFDAQGLARTIRSIYHEQPLDIQFDAIEDKDWVVHVQQMWKPQIIGDLTIMFPWHEEEEINTKQSLILEGGAAFGTGDHPTTRLCCKWLQENVKQYPSATLLDYGCGSAILALAGLKYGVKYAAGTDIDKDALSSANRNAKRNNLPVDLYLVGEEAGHDRVDECDSVMFNTLRGNAEEFPTVDKMKEQKYDLVVANILAPILINLAPILSKHVNAKGKLAMSGIIAKQAQTVINAYQPYFSKIQVQAEEDDWVLVTAYN